MSTNQPIILDKIDEVLEKEPSAMKQELKQNQEVLRIADSIDHRNQIAILEYGKETANEISNFSSKVLHTIQSNSMEESSALLKHLGKIMDKFDSKDFVENKGVFSKFFSKGKKLIEKLMVKYQTMGSEIDKVYAEIVKYEKEMKQSTLTLENLYEQNYEYYMQLESYIAAGELKLEELKTKLPALEQRAATGNQIAGMELDSLRNSVELLEQRVYDLEMAKQVAYQSAPQIRMLQRGNTKLIGKINSAFVTTIPIFKSGLINAISAKRQHLVAESMSELDRRTNEMLLRNAQTISKQSTDIARLAGSPSVKVETLEQTWDIIIKGMEDTKAIEEENKKLREEGKQRLVQLQQNFEQRKLEQRI